MEAVVVDAGSKLLKAGLAVAELPPSMIIPSRIKNLPKGESSSDAFVDPVVRGFISDWDAMEDLLSDVLYSGLGWEIGNEGHILFAEPLKTPKAVREQLVELMFEKFNVSGFFAIEQAILSLYSVGRVSGCCVDIGHGKMDIAAVVEGAVRHISSRRFKTGGSDLTTLFAQKLVRSNPHASLSTDDVENLKEKYACSAEDRAAYGRLSFDCPEVEHTLPDGQVIKIGRERYDVGEVLFQPRLLGLESQNVIEQFIRCISTVFSQNLRQLLLENIILCGGRASMTGFKHRFQREANHLFSSAIRPCLVKPHEHMPENLETFSAWTGGAILANVVFLENQHVTKADYDEVGPSIVHLKCV